MFLFYSMYCRMLGSATCHFLFNYKSTVKRSPHAYESTNTHTHTHIFLISSLGGTINVTSFLVPLIRQTHTPIYIYLGAPRPQQSTSLSSFLSHFLPFHCHFHHLFQKRSPWIDVAGDMTKSPHSSPKVSVPSRNTTFHVSFHQ